MPDCSLYVAVSCKPPRGAWSWRRVDTTGPYADGTGTEANASAYRLRLHALVAGLRALPAGTDVEVVTTDSSLEQLATAWLPAWRANDWRKKGIQSVDLVKQLAEQLDRHTVGFRHLRSRTGDNHAKDCSKHAKDAAAHMTAEDLALPPPKGHVEVRADTEVVAWTDGGSRKNPGPSGWGAVLVHHASGTTMVLRGGETVATNNRMELTAVAEALDAFKRRTRVEVRTDSRFVISAATQWRHGWKRRGWRKADGEEPANLDVIQRLDALLDRHDVVFTWVPGHTGEPGNELADQLCNEAIDAVLAGTDPESRTRQDAPPFEIRRP